ncbi:MAG: hypothetical protein VX193_02435 [Candidatus Thermoplasmatota archaeon]|nr:hypothetical protein [Candidatus Thermoplasmatota archaeon]
MKLRKLEEVLNPQPDATVVIHRLLAWMDRVDLATQRGMPRPPFQTPEGEHIFPPEEELWWLTDVSKRALDEEPQAADEDGPPSGLEEEQAQEVSCSDPGSSDGADPPPHTTVLAWRR